MENKFKKVSKYDDDVYYISATNGVCMSEPQKYDPKTTAQRILLPENERDNYYGTNVTDLAKAYLQIESALESANAENERLREALEYYTHGHANAYVAKEALDENGRKK